MPNHNSFPGGQAETQAGSELGDATLEAIRRAQLVKFVPRSFVEERRQRDAAQTRVAILCRTPGDTLTFNNKTAEQGNPDFMNLGKDDIGAVWVVTDTGNKYGIANGFVYNHNAKGIYALDPNADKIQLCVGQESYIPGVGETSPIKSILINDAINDGSGQYSWTGKDASDARYVNAVDPFTELAGIGDAIDGGGDVGSAYEVVRIHATDPLNKASFV